jgi:L-fuconate dehydratase
VNLLHLSYLEDVRTSEEATAILHHYLAGRGDREQIVRRGYPGYDRSVGWFHYEDNQIKDLARKAMSHGFRAFKLVVGSYDEQRDLRRASMLREIAGQTRR